jgi:hypothetical protein
MNRFGYTSTFFAGNSGVRITESMGNTAQQTTKDTYPGIRRAVIWLMDFSGLAVKRLKPAKFF